MRARICVILYVMLQHEINQLAPRALRQANALKLANRAKSIVVHTGFSLPVKRTADESHPIPHIKQLCSMVQCKCV